ncbi:hypothetical protein E8E12_001025 [Didymella heteroderae]|uniref:Uncharacterized protein n=1 Tax=Didymella heteroderae TaxID=1769908 RepID=A0A9P4WG36_9PLEO|nr:hypothetical protein E8E12_001025 [Didymella heteroderae]
MPFQFSKAHEQRQFLRPSAAAVNGARVREQEGRTENRKDDCRSKLKLHMHYSSDTNLMIRLQGQPKEKDRVKAWLHDDKTSMENW